VEALTLTALMLPHFMHNWLTDEEAVSLKPRKTLAIHLLEAVSASGQYYKTLQ
jgi:hypothetical protein